MTDQELSKVISDRLVPVLESLQADGTIHDTDSAEVLARFLLGAGANTVYGALGIESGPADFEAQCRWADEAIADVARVATQTHPTLGLDTGGAPTATESTEPAPFTEADELAFRRMISPRLRALVTELSREGVFKRPEHEGCFGALLFSYGAVSIYSSAGITIDAGDSRAIDEWTASAVEQVLDLAEARIEASEMAS